jgi:hypothetical protein
MPRVCREFWRQVVGRSIRAAFPKYTVDGAELEDGTPPRIAVKYVDGRTQTLAAQHLTVDDIFAAMAEFTEDLIAKEDDEELEKN